MRVRFGPSFLGVRDTTGIQESMDSLIRATRIAHVLVLATAAGRALTPKCPSEADRVPTVLWDRDVMALEKGRNGGVTAFGVTAKEAALGMGVEDLGNASLAARRGACGT